jgi:hypothetical protein
MEMERKEREEEETRWRDGVTYKKLLSHRCIPFIPFDWPRMHLSQRAGKQCRNM